MTRNKLVLTPDLVALVDRCVPQDHLPADAARAPMTDADHRSAADEVLAMNGPGDISIFGYGSLLWNPGFAFAGRQPATLKGWHRVFCMKLLRFRGSPEQPGLMLALDHGGSCKGEVFRITGARAAGEIEKLMRREVPCRQLARAWRFVHAGTPGGKVWALAFYAGMRRDLVYACLPIEQQAHMLARAAGYSGSGAAYLHQTVMKLEELGIHDSCLWRLQHLVATEIRAMFPDLADRLETGAP